MSKNKAKAENEQAQRPQAEQDSPADNASGDPVEGARQDSAEQALESARAEAQQAREQALRAQAELENVRKRAERDVESARKFALEKFVTDLLGVRDSLEMGLQSAAEKSGDYDKLKEGMDLTARMLVQTMERFGVETIQPEGEAFNPDFHEAMSAQETDEQPPNTVLNVMQKGYSLNGRVLRPAMVVVSKKPAAE